MKGDSLKTSKNFEKSLKSGKKSKGGRPLSRPIFQKYEKVVGCSRDSNPRPLGSPKPSNLSTIKWYIQGKLCKGHWVSLQSASESTEHLLRGRSVNKAKGSLQAKKKQRSPDNWTRKEISRVYYHFSSRPFHPHSNYSKAAGFN